MNGISLGFLIVAGHCVLLTLTGLWLLDKKKARKMPGPSFSVESGT
jgi:hypothetical protein